MSAGSLTSPPPPGYEHAHGLNGFLLLLKASLSGWPSKIANLVGGFDWLSASKPLVMKVKVGGSEQCVNISLKRLKIG